MGKTWEYDRQKFENEKILDIFTELNALGANGWEIISYEEKKPETFGKKFECIVVLKKRNYATKKKHSDT